MCFVVGISRSRAWARGRRPGARSRGERLGGRTAREGCARACPSSSGSGSARRRPRRRPSGRTSTPGHSRGSRSSTFASSTPGLPSRCPGRPQPVDLARAISRTTFGRPGSSRVPAPIPTVVTVQSGRVGAGSASVVTSAIPVGVASSPCPPASTCQPLRQLQHRRHRHRDLAVRRPDAARADSHRAGSRCGRRPARRGRRTHPPRRRSSPRHRPRGSARSRRRCRAPVASASRERLEDRQRALLTSRLQRRSPASIARITVQSRCGRSSTSTSTSTLRRAQAGALHLCARQPHRPGHHGVDRLLHDRAGTTPASSERAEQHVAGHAVAGIDPGEQLAGRLAAVSAMPAILWPCPPRRRILGSEGSAHPVRDRCRCGAEETVGNNCSGEVAIAIASSQLRIR